MIHHWSGVVEGPPPSGSATALNGDPITIYCGDAYSLAAGNPFEAIDTAANWPATILAATLVVTRRRDGFQQLVCPGVQISPTQYNFYPTQAQTAAMLAGPQFACQYKVVFTVPGPGATTLPVVQIAGLCSVH